MKLKKIKNTLLLLTAFFSCSIKEKPEENHFDFGGPMIEWNSYESVSDTLDVISLLIGEKDVNPPPTYNFLKTEFEKYDLSRNCTDSLLDNIDFRRYFGPILERFRMTYLSNQGVPSAIEIGKYRPGRYMLIIKYFNENTRKEISGMNSKGLNYNFFDSLSSIDSIGCSRILAIARNLHPVDTGQEMSCFHRIEYHCAYPDFSTCFNINCTRVKDNKEYFELLKICAELMKSNLTEKELVDSYLTQFIDDVYYWDTLFYKDSSERIQITKKWKFFNLNKR